MEKSATENCLISCYRLKTFQVQFVAEPPEFPAGSPCRSSEDVQRVARAIYDTLDADKEHFLLLTMNNKNRVNGFKVVSTGSLTASLVHPREVWRSALHLCAAAVIFVHNHPSGDPAPSPEDQDITRHSKRRSPVTCPVPHPHPPHCTAYGSCGRLWF